MPVQTDPAYLCIDATRNPFAVYNGNPDYRLLISVKDHTRESIYFGLGALSTGSLTWRVHDPTGAVVATGTTPVNGQPGFINTYAQAVAGPDVINPAGYNPIMVVPAMNGDYFLTFQYPGAQGERDFAYFDITVVDILKMTGVPGRVWSKAWQFWTIVGGNQYQPYWGKMYIYSKDSIVTQFDPNGFDGREFSFAANESGCYPIGPGHPPAEARQSRFGEHTYPEYKIFLNDPDTILYPNGVLGGLDTTFAIVLTPSCLGTVDFTFRVTKAGNVEIHLQLSTLGPPYVDRIIPSPVASGVNTLQWDGYDGAVPAHQILNGATFPYYITYLNGLTNLPLFDVENNNNGFRLALIRPTKVPPPPAPLFYWDDSQIWAANVNLTGCLPTPFAGCHTWQLNINNYQHDQTVNTWWYVLSMSTRPVMITQHLNMSYNAAWTICRGDSVLIGGVWVKTAGNYTATYPSVLTGCDSTLFIALTVNPSPVVNLGPDVLLCQGQTHTFDAGAGAGYTYSWDNLTTHTYNIATTRFYTTGTTGLYKVTVTNPLNCHRADSAQLTVNPVPVITTNPLSQMICSNGTTSINLSSNVPGTIFTWTAIASSNLVTGYSGGSGNNIIQVISNTSNLLQTVTYHITPSSNGCAGIPADYIVSVNAVPNVSFQPPAQAICSGQTTSVNLLSTTPGTIFAWTPVSTFGTPPVTGQTPGTGNILLQTLFNLGTVPGSVTYAVQPLVNSCPGIPGNIVILVNPLPSVTFTACFDDPTQDDARPIRLKGGIPLNGIYSGPGVAGGFFNPAVAGAGTHLITYTYTNMYGCSAQATHTIRVIAAPGVFVCGNILTDVRDNRQYPTVQIGTQCWMAANLNYGNWITAVNMQWDNCIPEKYCFQDNPVNCSNSGGLYQWDELMRFEDIQCLQGMCPPGWHIPDETEWNTLFAVYNGPAYAGGSLKTKGSSGFNANFPGQRFMNRSWSFNTFATHFWSSTSHSVFKAWAHAMNLYDPGVAWYPALRSNAFPVRCLKD